MNDDLEKEFDYAGNQMNALLDEMEAEGCNTGAILAGSLTALLFRLVVQSPDNSTVMGMLSSAMGQAANIAAAYAAADEEETKH